MIVLLDTATATCYLSLVDSDQAYDYQWQADRQLANGLLGFIRRSLTEHDWDFSDITGLAVKDGPGSFTGLRIGLTVMNTLASSLEVPIVASRGSTWQDDALQRLDRQENDEIVMPFYGSEANITKPRK